MDVLSTYRQGNAQGATTTALVGLLYEQMVNDLRVAQHAIDEGNVEFRTKQINHAILVLGHLQTALNEAAGEKVARQLEAFYNQIRQNLVHAQATASRDLLARQITDLLCVREAWCEVERLEHHSEHQVSDASQPRPSLTDPPSNRLNTEV